MFSKVQFESFLLFRHLEIFIFPKFQFSPLLSLPMGFHLSNLQKNKQRPYSSTRFTPFLHFRSSNLHHFS